MTKLLTKKYYGWRRSNPDHRDYMFAANPFVIRNLPTIIDLDSPSPGSPFDPCWDQLNLGSCGPNTLAENITFDVMSDPNLKGKMKMMPSRLFNYYTTRLLMGTINSDSGVDNRTMLKAAAQFGWCDASLWPYIVNNFTKKPPQAAFKQASTRLISQYLSVPQDLMQMKACIAGNSPFGIQGKPFIFGFTVYESFESANATKTGIIPMPGPTESVLGGHDILFCGYNDFTQMFKFRNHWSKNWGDRGYGYMPYAYAINSNLSGDFWMVQTAPF